MQRHKHQHVSLHLSPTDIEFCENLLHRQLTARQEVGAPAYGISEVRQNVVRGGPIARVPGKINGTDNLVGHLGAFAVHKLLFGKDAKDRYQMSRNIQDQSPVVGDLSDILGYRIDIKTSLIRNPNLRSDTPHVDLVIADKYHLAVPPRERDRVKRKGFVYIKVFLLNACKGKQFYAPNGCEATIVGWMPEAELPDRPTTQGAFTKKFLMRVRDLYPMGDFSLDLWRDRLQIGAREKRLGGALAPFRYDGKQYPVDLRYRRFPDAWSAYLDSRRQDCSVDMGAMIQILTAKFHQYPELLKGIDDRGGVDWLRHAEFFCFSSDAAELRLWYGKGEQSPYVKAIVAAYDVASSF